MGKRQDILKLIEGKNDNFIMDYSNKIFDNLKDLNGKEEKNSLYAVIIVFLYLILYNSTIESFDIGPITIKDISIVSKILPLVFMYVIFNLKTISSHKKDVLFTIKTLSEIMFNQKSMNEKFKEFGNNFVTRTYLPYTFSNSISKITSEKPHIIESFIGFPLILPVIFVGAVPYAITFLMLIDLYNNNLNDILGYACFGLTIWAFLLMIFYTVLDIFKSNSENDIL